MNSELLFFLSVSAKILSSIEHDKKKKLEHRISILERFMKDHVTFKTEVMGEINSILKYIKLEICKIVILFHNTTILTIFLKVLKDFFQNHYKI